MYVYVKYSVYNILVGKCHLKVIYPPVAQRMKPNEELAKTDNLIQD